MSTQAVGQDLMSLLKMFTSPRMGPFENTNTTSPFPPGSDQARQQSDPSRMGVEQQPPPSPGGGGMLPPGFPSPVARRVVQPDGGAQPATDPRADQPAPGAAVVAGKGPAGTAPAGEDLTTFMESQPDYQAYLRQLRKRQAEAYQEQALANVFGGLSEFADARSGGGGGKSQSKQVEIPTGDLTLGQFGEFQKRKEGIIAEAEEKKRIDKIVADPRMKGVTREVLDSLRANDPKKYAELIKDYFSGETETFTDPTTGTVYSRPKRGDPGAKPTVILESPETQAKAAAALEATKAGTGKTYAETTQTAARTEQINQEVTQGKIDPHLQSDATLKILAKTLGQDPNDPNVIRSLRDMSPKELQETFKTTTAAAAARNDPREWEGKEILAAQEDRKKIRNSLGQIPIYESLQKILADKPRLEASASAELINAYYRNINTIFGSPLDEKTLGADAFKAQVADLVRGAIKDYGANPSNSDREAAAQQFGANTPPEVAKRQLGLVLKAKIWEVQRHNADKQDRIDNTDMSSGSKAALKAQMVDMPAVTDSTLKAMNIQPAEVQWLKDEVAAGGERAAEARAAFEKDHGRVIGEWALGEVKR